MLAAEASTFAANGNRKTNEALYSFIEAGRRLNEAKKIVGHGRFMQWVNDNCAFKYRAGAMYMDLAEALDTGFFKIATIANLTLTGAVKEFKEASARKHEKLRDLYQKPGKNGLPSTKLARAEPQWHRPDGDQILYVEWNTEKYGYLWASGGDGIRTFDWILLDYTSDDEVRHRSSDDDEVGPTTWERLTLGLLHEWGTTTDGVKRQEPWQRDSVIMQMLRHLQQNVAFECALEVHFRPQIHRLKRQLEEAQKELDAQREQRPPSVRPTRLNGADSGRKKRQNLQAGAARSDTRKERGRRLDDDINWESSADPG
jgi:hypothetical protein